MQTHEIVGDRIVQALARTYLLSDTITFEDGQMADSNGPLDADLQEEILEWVNLHLKHLTGVAAYLSSRPDLFWMIRSVDQNLIDTCQGPAFECRTTGRQRQPYRSFLEAYGQWEIEVLAKHFPS